MPKAATSDATAMSDAPRGSRSSTASPAVLTLSSAQMATLDPRTVPQSASLCLPARPAPASGAVPVLPPSIITGLQQRVPAAPRERSVRFRSRGLVADRSKGSRIPGRHPAATQLLLLGRPAQRLHVGPIARLRSSLIDDGFAGAGCRRLVCLGKIGPIPKRALPDVRIVDWHGASAIYDGADHREAACPPGPEAIKMPPGRSAPLRHASRPRWHRRRPQLPMEPDQSSRAAHGPTRPDLVGKTFVKRLFTQPLTRR